MSALPEHVQIEQDFITRTLDIYRKEYVAVRDAVWESGRLRATVLLLPYSAVQQGVIDYVTASAAVLYASQLSYVTARFMINQGAVPNGISVTEDDFFRARDQGALVFTELTARFRRKILLSSQCATAELRLSDARAHKNHIFTRLETHLDGGACRVSGVLAMPFGTL